MQYLNTDQCSYECKESVRRHGEFIPKLANLPDIKLSVLQINTAYQIGGGVSLAICSAVVQEVAINRGHGVAQQYTIGLWCTSGIAGMGLIFAVFFLKNDHSGSMKNSPEASRDEILENVA